MEPLFDLTKDQKKITVWITVALIGWIITFWLSWFVWTAIKILWELH